MKIEPKFKIKKYKHTFQSYIVDINSKKTTLLLLTRFLGLYHLDRPFKAKDFVRFMKDIYGATPPRVTDSAIYERLSRYKNIGLLKLHSRYFLTYQLTKLGEEKISKFLEENK